MPSTAVCERAGIAAARQLAHMLADPHVPPVHCRAPSMRGVAGECALRPTQMFNGHAGMDMRERS